MFEYAIIHEDSTNINIISWIQDVYETLRRPACNITCFLLVVIRNCVWITYRFHIYNNISLEETSHAVSATLWQVWTVEVRKSEILVYRCYSWSGDEGYKKRKEKSKTWYEDRRGGLRKNISCPASWNRWLHITRDKFDLLHSSWEKHVRFRICDTRFCSVFFFL